MLFGAQIFAMIIVIVVAMEFFHYRRLRLLSTKIYELFVLLSFVSITFEITSIYAISHPDNISMSGIRSINQFLYISLNFLTWLAYLYIDTTCKSLKTYSYFDMLWRSLPLIVSIIYVFIGTIQYHMDETGFYYYGTIINSYFFNFVCYYFLIIVTVVKYRSSNPKLVQYDFILLLIIWFLIELTQYLYQYIFVPSIALALILFFFYIIFENADEYADKDISSLFSRYSFDKTILELYANHGRFWVINCNLQSVESIRNTYGQSMCLRIIEATIQNNPELRKQRIFRTLEYSFCFILESEEEVMKWYANYRVSDKTLKIGVDIQAYYNVHAIECPKIAKGPEELNNLMVFTNNTIKNPHYNDTIYVVTEAEAQKFEHSVAVESLIQRALDEDGFDIYYQPIISAKTKKCVSCEALVRLKDKTTVGFISPEFFIPIAEKKGVISKLGEQVFSKVCQFAKKYDLENAGLQYIDVNLSGMQMIDPMLSYRLHGILKNYSLQPDFINFEITETVTYGSDKVANDNIEKLKKLGYKFSMDDFGTGYSNFSNVASIKYDSIKIDKSLLWNAFDKNALDIKSDQALKVLKAIIAMIRSIGAKIVAEGVESEAQAEFLTEAGVDFFQGFLYSKPLNEEDFLEYFARQHETQVQAVESQKNSVTVNV